MPFLVTVALLYAVLSAPSSASARIRGAPPSFDGTKLTCIPIIARKGGAKPVISERINDDYCDCLDGADEPGTSACSNGRFYCVNTPHQPRFIPSSHVDDGVCDCCDGSDEPAGRCANTCAEASNAAMKEAREKAAIIMKGLKQRKEMSRAGKKSEKKERVELRDKKLELEQVKSELETCRRHEDGLRAYQKTAVKDEKSNDAGDDHVPVGDGEHDGDAYDDEEKGIDEDELVNKPDEDDEPKEEEIDDEAQDYGYEDAGDEVVVDDASTETQPEAGATVPNEQDSPPTEAQSAENASDTAHIDLEPFCQELVSGKGNLVMQNARLLIFKLGASVRKLAPRLFGIQAPKELDKCIERAEARRSELESKQSTLEREIEDLEKKLSRDYGEDGAMRGLIGQCFKKKLTQYEWEHCPFDVVKQHEHGRYIASLGDYRTTEGNVMVYDGGAGCWNGPSRSVKVTLVCGAVSEVIAVDEPNRCTYTMIFATPAVCEEKDATALLNPSSVEEEMKTEL